MMSDVSRPVDIRQPEILSDEKQGLSHGLGQRVSEAIAEVQSGRMPALSESPKGRSCDFRVMRRHRDGLNTKTLEQDIHLLIFYNEKAQPPWAALTLEVAQRHQPCKEAGPVSPRSAAARVRGRTYALEAAPVWFAGSVTRNVAP